MMAWAVWPMALAADGAEMRLDRAEDGLFLSANLSLTLPDLVEDALQKGVPMHFVMEAQVLRDRWYWSDKSVATATRYLRLSYQPLTRRWRLNVSSSPITGTGLSMALGQSLDDLDDALAAMQRIARWKIAEAGVVDPASGHTVQLRVRLDMTQLPRPMQLGTVGRPGWSVLLARSQRLAS